MCFLSLSLTLFRVFFFSVGLHTQAVRACMCAGYALRDSSHDKGQVTTNILEKRKKKNGGGKTEGRGEETVNMGLGCGAQVLRKRSLVANGGNTHSLGGAPSKCQTRKLDNSALQFQTAMPAIGQA